MTEAFGTWLFRARFNGAQASRPHHFLQQAPP